MLIVEAAGNGPTGEAATVGPVWTLKGRYVTETFLLLIELDDPDTSIQIALARLPGLEDATVGRFVVFLRDEARSRRLL